MPSQRDGTPPADGRDPSSACRKWPRDAAAADTTPGDQAAADDCDVRRSPGPWLILAARHDPGAERDRLTCRQRSSRADPRKLQDLFYNRQTMLV